MPISPCEPHPDSQRLLHLEKGRELRKKSYVKIDTVYEVDWRLLGAYDENEATYRLTRQSLEDLDDAVGFYEANVV